MPVPPELIGELFDSHARALALYARQICDDFEDVVQLAFMKLADQQHAPDAPVAWLYRVVRNEAPMATRAAHRRERREQAVGRNDSHWFRPTAGESMDATAVSRAVALLAEDQREIVTSHIWGGLSFREIGSLLGISDSAAHRRYQEALQSLRNDIEKLCR